MSTEQEKVEPQPASEETPNHLRETGEKLWDKTRKTFQSATCLANKYKQVVQKKIDLAAVHKKIANAHADLGKLVDDNRGAAAAELLEQDEAKRILTQLDDLKASAALLLQEIEVLKQEQQ